MRLSLALAIAVLLAMLPLYGQIDNGNITGRVTDQSGAVIPGAQVTVTQTAMNFETVAQTNEEGLYRAPQLRPGPYRITVVAQGFKRYVREQIELRMGETLAINVPMEVGAVAESIEVQANAQLLETETSSTGQVVAGDYFYNMPNFQRNTKAILFYTPGMSFNGLAWTGGLGQMHVNGMPSGYIGVFEDGALGALGGAGGSAGNGAGYSTDTIMNTIADIKVLTTTMPAEYGHSAGGAISVVKKSGTNEIHGVVSEYGRVRRMQHRKYFDRYRNSQPQPGWSKAPGLIFQNPDANISGPVYIPKIYDGRNKTFFMFAWQGMIEKQSKQQQSTVPTLDMLNGDFSFGGIGQAIYDPSTTRQVDGKWYRDAYAGNIIPKNAWSNVAKTVLGMNPYQAPNVPGSLTSSGPSGNIMTGPMKIVRWDNYSFRLDQQFTPSLKAYGTWTNNSRWERTPPYTLANSFFDGTLNKNLNKQNTISAGTTWIPTSTMVNDLRASYYSYASTTSSIAYMNDYATQLGLSGLPKDCMPQLWPGGFTESLNVGCPSRNVQEIITIKDDISKAWGTHAFKFGYELLRFRQNQWDLSTPDGNFSYQGTQGLGTNGSNVSNTGNTFANFLTGAIRSVNFSRRLNSNLPRVWQHSMYFQDDWKVTPTLTLNLGLRYNLETPPSQKYGLISIFDRTAADTSLYTNYTCNGCVGSWTHPSGSRAYDFDKTRFDPRFGFAWHPVNRIVVRGGLAVTHVDMRASYLYTDELMSDSTSISQADGNPTPLFYLNQGVPAYTYPAHRADGSVPYKGNANGHSANVVQQDLKAPHTYSWNFGVQTELSADYMLELQYKGSLGTGIVNNYDTNTRPWATIPNPNGNGFMNLDDPANASYRNTWVTNTQPSRPWNNWGNLNVQGNNGRLSHHEGMAKIEKRFSKGLNFIAFYTYSKSIERGTGNPYLSWDLTKTLAGYDQTHNFTGTMNYEIPIGKGRRFLNHGGLLNTLVGGFNFSWTYTIASGSPQGVSISGSPYSNQQYPGYMPTYGSTMLLKVPELRSNWQDLGANRFNQNSQNPMLDCANDGSFVALKGNSCMQVVPAYSRGNNANNIFRTQRVIAASMSASKEVPIRERLKFQFRFDMQNPFKWYNWGAPSSALNISSVSNARSFGTVGVGSSEGTTAAYGGLPMMNITLALKW